MIDPVAHAGDHWYERSILEDWLKDHDTSPRSKKKVDKKSIFSLRPLKIKIKNLRVDKLNAGLEIFPKLMSKDHL